ncbi:MAG: hypothetical protein IPH12_18745 [Saprospirales bacterium]|nr:hypothetical protein [Saprospirales bacterium]
MTPEDMQKLDMKSEHGAMLEAAETLEALAKIADDPLAYDPVLFDAAYTRAEQLAHSFCGMMMGLRAAEIAATFRRAVRARKACEKYDLVPKAALESRRRLSRASCAAEAKMQRMPRLARATLSRLMAPREGRVCACVATQWRVMGAGPGATHLAIKGHPWPLPRRQTTASAPPADKANAVDGQSLRRAYCAHVGGPRLAAWDMLGAQTRRMFEALAYVANVRMGIESP